MAIKYPRTQHMPWSMGVSKDDSMLLSLEQFRDKTVVVTEKMDGENTTLYSDNFHARSLDGRHHPSRDWVKGFHGQIKWQIPPGWRICGENLYAQHSIRYENLSSYFMVFSVWDQHNHCLPWATTKQFCKSLGIHVVPEICIIKFDADVIKQICQKLDTTKHEGIVIRNAAGFNFANFDSNVAKFVRPNHVQTNKHWSTQKVVPNKKVK